LPLVQLHTFADNPRAQAAFQKVGFREVRRGPINGGRIDVLMTLPRQVWLDRRRPAPVAAGHAQARTGT
jgi:RimJ/RimL family protein N-acetyltransferase